MVSEHKVQTLGLDEAQLAFMKQWFWIILPMYFSFKFYSTEKLFLKFNNRYGKAEGICGRGSPFTEQENLPRDPIQEDLTTNSLELL